MELYEINNIIHKVKETGDMAEFTNGEDCASIHFVERTGRLLFMFNAVPLFTYKRVRSFRDKAMTKIEQYKLIRYHG